MDRETGGLVLSGAVAAMVVGIYQLASPGIANIRVSEPNDKDLGMAEKQAAWLSTVVVGSVAVIAREPLVFILGAGTIVGLSWWHKHANSVNPSMEAMKRRSIPMDSVPSPGSSSVGSTDRDSVEHSMDTSAYEGVF